VAGVLKYLLARPVRFFSLGLVEPPINQENVSGEHFTTSSSILVFVYYWFVLTMQGLAVMHIQVLTRFLCATSPALFWFISSQLAQQQHATRNSFIMFYCISFSLIGCVLFSNFYPWT